MIFGLIMVLFLVAYAIQGEEGKTLRLAYVVEPTGAQTSSSIHPSYVWYGDSNLTIPIQERHTDERDYPLQDICLLSIDFSKNNPEGFFILTRVNINGMSLFPSTDTKSLYIVPFVFDKSQRINSRATRIQEFLQYNNNVISASSREIIMSNRSAQPYNIQPYPSALTSLNTTKLYKGTEREAQQGLFGAYDWESWGEYIVGFGNTIGTSEDDSPLIFHDLRLYDQQGNTVSIFPHVKLVPNDLTGIATTLQVSPDGRFLMVSPHNFRGREDGFLDVNQRNVLLIYEIIESGASNANETMLLRIPREIDGTLETGAVVDIEKYVIDGSQMSAKITGFVVAQDPSDGEK